MKPYQYFCLALSLAWKASDREKLTRHMISVGFNAIHSRWVLTARHCTLINDEIEAEAKELMVRENQRDYFCLNKPHIFWGTSMQEDI